MPNARDFIIKGGVFPTRFGKEGKNFAQTFGQWRKGTTKSQNSFEYYLDGLSILSPLDIIFLQDEIDQTNWVPHFCKFVRMRLTNECHATPERNTSCTEFPWLFCLTHMLHERLIVQTDRGVLPRMFKIIGAMRGYIHSRTMEGIYSVATFKDWVAWSPERVVRHYQIPGGVRCDIRQARPILLVPRKHDWEYRFELCGGLVPILCEEPGRHLGNLWDRNDGCRGHETG